MRLVIQRVLSGKVVIDGQITGNIDKGIVAFVGFMKSDNTKTIEYMLDKLFNLRIFEDSEEKMNLSVIDINKKVIIVPNFTLYGNVKKGKRPSFTDGASPSEAVKIFEEFKTIANERYGDIVQFGVFQADMKVEIINDGPCTLLVDSEKIF